MIFEKMNKQNWKKSTNIVLIVLFAISAIFVPADPLEIKKISLVILLIFNCISFLKINEKDEKIIFGFGFILTSLTIVLSICLTGQLYQNISIGYCGYILLLYFSIKKNNIDFVKIVIKILMLLAYFISIMALLDILGIIPMYSNNFLMWFHKSGNAMIGKGNHLAIGYCIFMKASPMLFLSLTYFFAKKNYVHAFVTCFALILSGTRANIIMCFAVVWLCFFYNSREQKKRIIYLGVTLIGVLVLLIDGRVVNMVVDMFARKAGGDSIRSDILMGIFDVWKENPLSFFTGSGFSAMFYNPGRDAFEYNVELSYWNLLRQVGIVPFVAFMIMYLYPIIRMLKNRENILVVFGYCAYLIIAYTNPLLYSSTGLTTLLFMYCICFDRILGDELHNRILSLMNKVS